MTLRSKRIRNTNITNKQKSKISLKIYILSVVQFYVIMENATENWPLYQFNKRNMNRLPSFFLDYSHFTPFHAYSTEQKDTMFTESFLHFTNHKSPSPGVKNASRLPSKILFIAYYKHVKVFFLFRNLIPWYSWFNIQNEYHFWFFWCNFCFSMFFPFFILRSSLLLLVSTIK